MIKRAIQENGLVADLYHDGTGVPRKAVVLLGGSEGGKVWSGAVLRKMREHLVGMGYTLLSLAYFKAAGLPATCEQVPLEYFEKAFAWLAKQPEVLPDGLALVGISKGAEVSLLLGSRNPNIKAIAALSGSGVVWQGVPKMGVDSGTAVKSSWSYAGKDVPFVPMGITKWNMGTVLFGKLPGIFAQALQNKAQVEQAAIPVEKIQCAILLMSGRRDQMWPAGAMSEDVVNRLAASGFAYPYQHVAYDSNHTGYILKKEPQQKICDFLKANYSQ